MRAQPVCPARIAAAVAALLAAGWTGCSLSMGGLPSDGDGAVRPDDTGGEVADDAAADADADDGADADAEVDGYDDTGTDADADVDTDTDVEAEAEGDGEADDEADDEADEEADAEADEEADAGDDGGPCPPEQTDCGGTCVDTRSDPDHCGGCFAPCEPGRICERSTCRCPTGTTLCDTECVDTTSDPGHCGGCFAPCAPGLVCGGSTCRCPTGTTMCGPECVDTRSDAAHCSGCFQACRPGAVCEGSVCRCPPGTSLCDGGTACTTAPDADGDGICDAEDPCSMDGPDSRVLPDPAAGAMVAISGVSLDGGSNVLLGVARGATFTLAYDWLYDDAARSCCACVTYISYGYVDSAGPAGCQGRLVTCTATGHFSTTMTAPMVSGTYFLGFQKHWEMSCPSTWMAPPPEQQYAAICVW